MTFSFALRAVLLSAVVFCGAACHHSKPPQDPQANQSSTPSTEAEPAEKPDSQGVAFGDGFYKDEASPVAVIRWVRRDARLRVDAPAEGHYRLTFRAFTVFSSVENAIEVSVNDQPAGSFPTRIFDLEHPTVTTLEVSLHAGGNAVRLHSKGPENRMSDTDDRMMAYGLVVPIMVERAP